MEHDITELFCIVDDFTKKATSKSLEIDDCSRKPTRTPNLSVSEIITILIMYQYSVYKCFKRFYQFLLRYHLKDFPKLPTYDNFIRLKQRTLSEMMDFIKHLIVNNYNVTNIYYVDSTDIKACGNNRISAHKTFKAIAEVGRTTKGWFYGLKLHLIVDANGEVVSFDITPGNVHDVNAVEGMSGHLKGLMFGDKGYISQDLFESLYNNGLKLITNLRKNMKNKLITLKEKMLLKKRSIIETVFDYLKNKFELEHTRHRSIIGGFIHIISTVIAYQMKKDKPSITIREDEVAYMSC